MNKAFGSHFKHVGRLLGLMEEFPDITDQFGCGHRAEFLPSVGGFGGWTVEKWVWVKGEIYPFCSGTVYAVIYEVDNT